MKLGTSIIIQIKCKITKAINNVNQEVVLFFTYLTNKARFVNKETMFQADTSKK